jgi:hypothetical protein
MANAKKCDRCGAFYVKNTRFITRVCRSKTVLDGVCFRTRDYGVTGSMDLCDDCIAEVKVFLSGKKEKED